MTFDTIATIIQLVGAAHPTRTKHNIDRRILKLIEELGEVGEAYLEWTSLHNKKNKTQADVCEEAADVLIVAIDIALTEIDEHSTSMIQADLLENARTHADPARFDVITLIRYISYWNALYAPDDLRITDAVRSLTARTVECAFLLNEKVWPSDTIDTAILSEIRRKLDKWSVTGTSTAYVVG